MRVLALATAAWIAIGGVLLFLLLLVLRWSLALLRETKGLLRNVSAARERLREATERIGAEARRASERLEGRRKR